MQRSEGMRLLEMAVVSRDGEAQIIFLARHGSASANHVRGRSELDNFEKERWSTAGGEHFPVTLYHSLFSVSLENLPCLSLPQNPSIDVGDAYSNRYAYANTRGSFGGNCESCIIGAHFTYTTMSLRTLTRTPLSSVSRISTINTMPLRAKVTNPAWMSGSRKVQHPSSPPRLHT